MKSMSKYVQEQSTLTSQSVHKVPDQDQEGVCRIQKIKIWISNLNSTFYFRSSMFLFISSFLFIMAHMEIEK